ncbi:hypothetical protein TNCV_3163151 [Trichonephila clavipes]|nr:hypothetical protein TNCV_3163151 [Trichonephila clavipes]
MNSGIYSVLELRTQQVSLRNVSECDGDNFLNCDLRYLSTTEKMPHLRIRSYYEQLSEFERGRIIGLTDCQFSLYFSMSGI